MHENCTTCYWYTPRRECFIGVIFSVDKDIKHAMLTPHDRRRNNEAEVA